MKILGKLSINPEKVLKNEELLNLRGGYDNDKCGNHCVSAGDCDDPQTNPVGCPRCDWAPGYQESKICTSP